MPAFVKGPSGHPTHSRAQSESPSPRPAAGASAHRTAPASFAPDRHHPRHGGLRQSEAAPFTSPRIPPTSHFFKLFVPLAGTLCSDGPRTWPPTRALLPHPTGSRTRTVFTASPISLCVLAPGSPEAQPPLPMRGAGKPSPPGHSLRDLCASNNSDTLCPHQSQPQKSHDPLLMQIALTQLSRQTCSSVLLLSLFVYGVALRFFFSFLSLANSLPQI